MYCRIRECSYFHGNANRPCVDQKLVLGGRVEYISDCWKRNAICNMKWTVNLKWQRRAKGEVCENVAQAFEGGGNGVCG